MSEVMNTDKYTYETGLAFAKQLDADDPLRHARDHFHIPKSATGDPLLYFCGNSLGLQPKHTAQSIDNELIKWADRGVKGHVADTDPWLYYQDTLTPYMAQIVGAKPIEVVTMNTLTANLHLMMVSFYNPSPGRHKILIEGDAFPSDVFAVESQLRNHGLNPETDLLIWKSSSDDQLLHYEDLEALLEIHGHEIALIMFGAVNYYTGQYLDLKRITSLGRRYGCNVGFDCAHAAGNVPLQLHDSGADFAIWCTYKYLNSGPGSLSGCFVHEQHAHNKDIKRFTGWWGHDKAARFNMRDTFDPIPGAEGWQLSNPPILSLAAIRPSLELFHQYGMDQLRQKSIKLTGYLAFLIDALNESKLNVITPSKPEERGCQLSLQVKHANKSLHTALLNDGVICDWREPDVIRCAPVPLYNTYEDVYHMVERLKKRIERGSNVVVLITYM